MAIPRIKWGDARTTHFSASKHPQNQLSAVKPAHYPFNPYAYQDIPLTLPGNMSALPTVTFRTCITSFLMHTSMLFRLQQARMLLFSWTHAGKKSSNTQTHKKLLKFYPS